MAARSTAQLLTQRERFLPTQFEAARETTAPGCAQLALAEEAVDDLVEASTVGGATGTWLTLLARGYGIRRATGESDVSIRARLRNVEDRLTRSAILDAVDAILAEFTGAGATMVEWFDDDATRMVYLDSSYLDDARLLGQWNTFYLFVPLLGPAAWGDLYLGTSYLDDEYLGDGPEHAVYASIVSEVENLRAAGVRWLLIMES